MNQHTDVLRIGQICRRLLCRFISDRCIAMSHTNGQSIENAVGIAMNRLVGMGPHTDFGI